MYFRNLGQEKADEKFKKMKKDDLVTVASDLYKKVSEYQQTIELMTHQGVSLLNEHNLLKLRFQDLKEMKCESASS